MQIWAKQACKKTSGWPA